MIVRRILFFVFLLGAWVQSASACTEALIGPATAHDPVIAQERMESTVLIGAENGAVIGGEHRCECPDMLQNVQSVVSESGKSALASYVEGASAFLISSNPGSIALAVHTRASSFIARRSAPPPYLLVPRLRQ
jgi:hypothetical protein